MEACYSEWVLVELKIFSALGSTAGSIADTDRGTDEELDWAFKQRPQSWPMRSIAIKTSSN